MRLVGFKTRISSFSEEMNFSLRSMIVLVREEDYWHSALKSEKISAKNLRAPDWFMFDIKYFLIANNFGMHS